MEKAIVVNSGLENTNFTEEELVRRAQSDLTYFKGLYLLWVTRVYQFIYARTGDVQDAEDLTSQTFLKACEAFPRYKHKGHFSAWLFTIARNEVNLHFRHNSSRQLDIEHADRELPKIDMLDHISTEIEMEQLRILIAELSEDEQELLFLRYVAEMKFGDIAIVVRRKEDTVKKSLYRLQARLQKAMEEDHE
ncbi:MAG: sigma-70 family RNA polymerase sigma factor [Chloroflexi bacterium]|nr:sigma-70 family RNA polymerase sigma factor [Chloroflexota bacterium]